MGYTRQRQTKQEHRIIYAGYHYTQASTNNVDKTWLLLQTTGGIEELNNISITFSTWNIYTTSTVYSHEKKHLRIAIFVRFIRNNLYYARVCTT
jgi:hypothetical protein